MYFSDAQSNYTMFTLSINEIPLTFEHITKMFLFSVSSGGFSPSIRYTQNPFTIRKVIGGNTFEAA